MESLGSVSGRLGVVRLRLTPWACRADKTFLWPVGITIRLLRQSIGVSELGRHIQSYTATRRGESSMSEGTKRRDFLKYTAATGMGYWVAGTKTWAQEADTKSPNEKVNFACVGVTGKGGSDSSHAAQVGNVVAICDTNEKALDRKAQEVPKARKFTDFRKMFDEMGKEFDAITVSI